MLVNIVFPLILQTVYALTASVSLLRRLKGSKVELDGDGSDLSQLKRLSLVSPSSVELGGVCFRRQSGSARQALANKLPKTCFVIPQNLLRDHPCLLSLVGKLTIEVKSGEPNIRSLCWDDTD